MKCIYSGKEESEATFKNREHIFPAGIGGINMLNKGDVSDEINNFFSNLERKFMRESIIQIPRIFFGPGKRGSLNKKETTRSKIFLMNNKNVIKIGYIELGIPKSIPQIKFKKEDIKVSVATQMENDNIKMFSRFEQILKERKKIIIKKSEKIDTDTSIIGFDFNKKEEKIYIYHNCQKFSLEDLIKYFEEGKIFEKIKNQCKTEKLNISLERELQISNEIYFDINEYFRICCKIALNGLCFLDGKEYVLKNEFTQIKNFILNGGENKFANLLDVKKNKNIENRLKKLQIPEYSHFMIFFHVEDGIHCILGIYGILHQIHLCGKIEYNDFLSGLICDWQNKKEYSLKEYVLEKIKNIGFYEQYFMND